MISPISSIAVAVLLAISSKTPRAIECQSHGLTGAVEVTLEQLNERGNAFEKLLDDVQQNASREYLKVLVHPGSVRVYRQIRKMVGQRPIDVSYDVAGAEAAVLPSRRPKVAKHVAKQSAFFECRNKQIYFVDRDAVQKPGAEDRYYRVNASYLAVGIIALEPRAGVAGDDETAFERRLAQLDPETQYIAFLVRDDSFEIYRRARMIADAEGFDTGWELLGADEPIKFGMGRAATP